MSSFNKWIVYVWTFTAHINVNHEHDNVDNDNENENKNQNDRWCELKYQWFDSAVTSIVFCHAINTLIVGGISRYVCLFIMGGHCYNLFCAHTDAVSKMLWINDTYQLVTCSLDGTIKIWNLNHFKYPKSQTKAANARLKLLQQQHSKNANEAMLHAHSMHHHHDPHSHQLESESKNKTQSQQDASSSYENLLLRILNTEKNDSNGNNNSNSNNMNGNGNGNNDNDGNNLSNGSIFGGGHSMSMTMSLSASPRASNSHYIGRSQNGKESASDDSSIRNLTTFGGSTRVKYDSCQLLNQFAPKSMQTVQSQSHTSDSSNMNSMNNTNNMNNMNSIYKSNIEDSNLPSLTRGNSRNISSIQHDLSNTNYVSWDNAVSVESPIAPYNSDILESRKLFASKD